jgi:hypothetical protein
MSDKIGVLTEDPRDYLGGAEVVVYQEHFAARLFLVRATVIESHCYWE